MLGHSAYRQIVAMGAPVVPLIVAEMRAGRLHWSAALQDITGEDPAAGAQSPQAATDAWLGWARGRGIGPV